jgi:hypothetical protein
MDRLLTPSLTHQDRRHNLSLMLQQKVFPHIIASRRLMSAGRTLDCLGHLMNGPDMPPQVHARIIACVHVLAIRILTMQF